MKLLKFLRLLTLLLLVCLSILSLGQPPAPNEYISVNYDKTDYFFVVDMEHLRNLKGDVHILTQYSYEVEVNPDATVHKGELVHGTPTFTFVFRPDKKIAEDWGYRKKEGEPTFKAYYRDFKNGKKDSSTYFRDGRITGKISYLYDSSQILIQEIMYDSNYAPKPQVISTYQQGDTMIVARKSYQHYYVNNLLVKYNQGNYLIKYYDYFPSGALKQIKLYISKRLELLDKFDEQGNLLYHYIADYINGTLDNTVERSSTYDINGRVLLQKETHKEKEHSRTSIALFYYYPDGKLNYIIENGREVARLTYNRATSFSENIMRPTNIVLTNTTVMETG